MGPEKLIETHIAFRDGTLAIQRLKHSFLSNLWSWNSLYIGGEITTRIGFLEWMNLN